MIEQGWHDEQFIKENVHSFDEFKDVLEKYTLDYAEKITGVSKKQLIRNG